MLRSNRTAKESEQRGVVRALSCIRQSVRDSYVTAAAAAGSASDAVVHAITHCDVTTTPSVKTGTPALADVFSPSSQYFHSFLTNRDR